MYKISVRTITCGLLVAATALASHAQTITATIAFHKAPVGIAANPATNLIYVAEPSYGGPTDTLEIINGQTDKLDGHISVPAGAQFPVVDLLHSRVYVLGCDSYSEKFSCNVTSVNSVTNKVIGTTTITETEGDGILGVTLDPVADKLYVANASNDRIDIVDGTTLKVVDRITTGDQEPFGVAFNPFNHRLYVVYYSDKVDIFNAVNKSLITSTTVGTQNVNVAVNWITGNVFVTDNVFGPSTTAVLDENGNVLARVPVSESPYGVAVDPISNKAFVVSTGIAALNVIDGGSNTVVGAIPGLTANYVSVNYVTGKVYLSGNSGVVVTTE